MAKRVQLTTDGHKPYLEAVEATFGCEIDYAQLIKIYGKPQEEIRYSPAECLGVECRTVSGDPDPLAHINVLRRAAEPNDADVYAPLHAVDERLL